MVKALSKQAPAYMSGKVKVGDRIMSVKWGDMRVPQRAAACGSQQALQQLLDNGPPGSPGHVAAA